MHGWLLGGVSMAGTVTQTAGGRAAAAAGGITFAGACAAVGVFVGAYALTAGLRCSIVCGWNGSAY